MFTSIKTTAIAFIKKKCVKATNVKCEKVSFKILKQRECAKEGKFIVATEKVLILSFRQTRQFGQMLRALHMLE